MMGGVWDLALLRGLGSVVGSGGFPFSDVCTLTLEPVNVLCCVAEVLCRCPHQVMPRDPDDQYNHQGPYGRRGGQESVSVAWARRLASPSWL